jgi:flagellar basal-body rod modification protein FlgD
MVDALTAASSSVGTSSETTAKSIGSLAKNFDSFLKLLTVQLKNQDPTSPMETNEFTNQIVSFSQVEQQINMNKNLETLISQNKNVSISNALSYSDKTVKVESDTFNLKSGKSTISYELPETAKEVTVNITTESGRVIRSLKGELGKGEHQIAWDGKDASGNVMDDGKYMISIAATNADGADITTKKYVTDQVTQIDVTGGNATLYMGEIPVDAANVKAVVSTNKGSTDTALSYIDKVVEAENDRFNVRDGQAYIAYKLPDNAGNVKISISDESGKVVKTINGMPLKGKNDITWNGKDDNGNTLEDGIYSIKIDAETIGGEKMDAQSLVTDIITNVDIDGDNASLYMGNIALNVNQVKSVKGLSSNI